MLYLDLPRYCFETTTIEPHYSVIRRAMALRAQSHRDALRWLLRPLRRRRTT